MHLQVYMHFLVFLGGAGGGTVNFLFFSLTSFLEIQWFSFGHEHTSDLSNTEIVLSALHVIFINLILSFLYLFAANEQIIMWAICRISVKLPHE